MKGFTKKLITLVISAILISCSSLEIVSARGVSVDRDVKIVVKQGRYNDATSRSFSTYSVRSYNDFFNAMEDSINKIEDSVKLIFENGYLKNSTAKFKANLEKIISIAGTGCYIDSYSAYRTMENGKEIYEIRYNYVNSISDARKKDNEVNKAVSTIIPKIIKSSMNVYEKEKAIHDYIVNNTRYDIENVENDTLSPEAHTPYGVFVKKIAVCDGYASAMKKMFDAVDIENKIIVGDSDGVPHAWNLVNLYGKWHHVDATWDDPIVKSKGKYKDVLTYDFFNKSDSYMEKTHTWIKADYPKAESGNVSSKRGKRFMSDRYL